MNKDSNIQGDNTSDLQQLNDTQLSILPEKEPLFQRRFDVGYDLPDDEYMKWLRNTHPESTLNQTASATKNDISNQQIVVIKCHLTNLFFFSEGLKEDTICQMRST